ncbi:mandelate racemase/muconate lactonizing enzyme family protein [Paenibacillus arenilitoris]|uniref:Mandelate racemase/muconate lactonizing enzyme family protein n=1 Tax=Paenibacillus arenilitoris TaxID=2772299 RepID=A0A927CPY4_9BACL|nr:mandelate racemase/muconate lactonizing enzyme family protein [Paenibacillus arenilitoris]MBD2870937.1 mandelate racemase/muconate lactonizing enzyme family protein [Paenibacillus arenilitoris]
MKIASIETFILRAPREQAYWATTGHLREEAQDEFFRDYSIAYPLRMRTQPHYTQDLTTLLVKITTDEGLVGWGESKAVVAPGAPKAIIEDVVKPNLIGLNPLDIAPIKEKLLGLMRIRGHIQGYYQDAISGVEIALWDIKGKYAGLPISSLLGGAFRDQIRIYASGLPGLPAVWNDADIARLVGLARKVVDSGFKAVKIAIGAGIEPDLRSVDIVRETVGDSYAILVDAGGIYDFQTALRLAGELERRGVFWFEAPLPMEDLAGYIELSQRVTIPVANDILWTGGLIKDVFQRGGRVIFLPEVLKAGGILECKQIADMADRFGLPFASHVSQGSYIQFAATAHVCAAVPNFLISEFWWQDNPLGNQILKNPLIVKDGYMEVPSGPGLGVEVDEEAIRPFIAG